MKVSIEKQSDGSYIAYNTDGEHCVLIGTGDTVKEAKEDFFNSIKEVSEDYIERGQTVPEELQQEPEFHFDISSLFEFYSMFNVSALGRYLGINPGLMRQYKKGDTPISDAQLKKIEAGIHRLATELSSLSLV
jgi:predicted RNase H-like HicB family nuclease